MSFPRYEKYKDSGIEWFGEVPDYWKIAALGYYFEVALGKMLDEKRITGNYLAPYLRNTDVQWGRINTSELPEMDFLGEDLVRYSLKVGDLLVCEGGEVGRAAIWHGELQECYYQKALHRLRPRGSDQDPKFMFYQLQFSAKNGRFVSSESRATISHLPAEALRRYHFCFPPLEEQQAIAEFLDRETSKIDVLVAEQHRLIDLLQEKRQATISHAVTKGLNPNAPTRDSGVEWLGQVPSHWNVSQSRRMFALRNEPALKSDRQLTASQKHGILYQSDFVELEGRRVVEVILGVESLKHVEPNDFVISMRSFQGGIEWSTLRGSISWHYVMLTPIKHVCPPYFAYLLKSKTYIQALRSTTDLIRDGQELRYSHFVKVDLPVVPIEEQEAIAAFLKKETSKLDNLVAEAERAIGLLQERRTALISAAVTGKIDVRGLAAVRQV